MGLSGENAVSIMLPPTMPVFVFIMASGAPRRVPFCGGEGGANAVVLWVC